VALAGQSKSGNDAESIRVLQLEDNPVDAELVARQLVDDGLRIASRVVASEIAFRSALAEFAPHVVLSDFSLPGFDGLSALQIATDVAPATPFIFVSGTIGEERAIEALKRGALDYVLKDNLRRLVPAIRGALRQAEATRARELAEEMLRRSESRLKDIINTSRDWIWECDRDGRFTFSSPSVLQILGYKHHELLGRRAAEYIDPVDELQMQATFAEVTSEEQLSKGLTLRWRHKTGKTRWLERSMVALRDPNGALTGVRGIDRDVTMRMAQETRIRRLNRALRFVSGASSAVMRLRDREQLVKEACRLAVVVGGYRKATIYLVPAESGAEPIVCSFGSARKAGTKWTMGGAMPEGVTPVTQALATGEPVILDDLTDPSGLGLRMANRDELLAASLRSCIALPLIMDNTAIGVVELLADEPGVFGDAELSLLKQVAANITFALQYLQSKESAEYLEYFDPLTSLANRSLYVQRLSQAIEEAARSNLRLALLVLDITGLGMINDGLGHHAGDLLLQLVAERLKNVFRDTNLMCRLGGDRFAVMSTDAASDAATVLKEQVACVFDAPFQIHDRELRVSVRAGLAQAPDDDRDAESLLQHAVTALEHAKEAGEQYLRHRPNMNVKASERLSLINDLRAAVSERRFILNYQPKVEIGTHRVDGVEALLRWPPKHGDAVPPNVFVPMLESIGLIDEVGGWVIVQALAETAAWSVADDAFRVAVNVSPLQLNREDFADRVLELVAGVGHAAERLELEVTESTLMADPRRASASLARLREAGVSIAIDDFGTGHSSLRVLAGLPVDVLKIDRSFVHDIVTNRSHRLIVQTTINLANSLGLKTVAEGVETPEQAEVLAELGCRSIQGYLIRRPASAAETATWLAGADAGASLRRAGASRRYAGAERAGASDVLDPTSSTARLRTRGRDA
jgi:diguanylate cyclase (GGDEF)-like protein/PAS domain S-box-containing protein